MADIWVSIALFATAQAPAQGTIEGKVLDKEGKPVAHARVYLPLSRQDSLDRDVPQWITTTSDSQGRFAFRGLPERTSKYGWYSLFAIHPDAGWTINVSRKIIPRNQSAVYVLILSPPTELITGHVVNPEKEPIAGAKVEILSASYRNLPPGIPEMNTITNQNGRFLLRVPPETQVVLKGTEDSYAPGYRNAMAGAQSTIVLFPASYIIAKFIDEETQQPVEGIPVKIVHPYDHYDDPIIQKSDPNGEARIKVPSETEFILYSENPTTGSYAPIKSTAPAQGETRDLGTIPVRRKPNISINIKSPKGITSLLPHTAISTTISTSLTFQGKRHEIVMWLDIKPDTITQIPLADGTYVIDAWATAEDKIALFTRKRNLIVSQGKPTPEDPISLTLQERETQRELSKVVSLTALRPDRTYPRRLWIGGVYGGGYTFWTVEGKIPLDVWTSDTKWKQLVLIDPDTNSGIVREVEDITRPPFFQLQPLPKKRVTVTTPDGKPLLRARLGLEVGYQAVQRNWTYTAHARTPIFVTTDARGQAELPYLPGVTCWAVAYRPGYELVGTRLDDTSKEITITLPRATSSYSGILVNEAGAPIKGAVVFATPMVNWQGQDPPTSTSNPVTYETVTDTNGKFHFHAMPQKIRITLGERWGEDFYYAVTPDPGTFIILRVIPRQYGAYAEIAETEMEEETPGVTSTTTVHQEFAVPIPNLEPYLQTNIHWITNEPKWNQNPTLVILTAPYLQDNAEWIRVFSQVNAPNCNVAMILDIAQPELAQEYCKEIGFSGAIGIWNPQVYTPRSLALYNLPTLPYPILLNTKREAISQGFQKEELAELLRKIQQQEERP